MKENKRNEILYQETFRPQFHFSPQNNWLNDPNGLVFFKGEYHLFYQYHPYSTDWGPMHWGHAVSKDLVHWEQLSIALKPDEHGHIFSGSAVVDWQNTTGFFEDEPGLVAIFTHDDVQPGTDRKRQRQSLAYSKDKGRTWLKYNGNPVLADEDYSYFRDPKVIWYEDSEQWIMLLAVKGYVHFYASPDLKTWSFLSEFGSQDEVHGNGWECPDLFELRLETEDQSRWVLTVGEKGNEQDCSNTHYFIGHFDGKQFISENSPDTLLWSDYGTDFYAAQSWSDIPAKDGRRIWLAWMSNFGYISSTPTDPWRGSMTIPRELKLRRYSEGIRLIQQPIEELSHLRGNNHSWTNEVISPEHNLLDGIQSLRCEIKAEFELIDQVEVFGFIVRQGQAEETVIGYVPLEELIFMDRSLSGRTDFDTSSKFARSYSAHLAPEQNIVTMHIYVDDMSVELFANDGKVVFTQLIFPESTSDGLEIFSKGGHIMLKSLEVFDLTSIWKA